MEQKLSHLSPSPVFCYFEEISNIPRGSGNTKGIASYLCEFAEKFSLKYQEDPRGNIIIWKNGRENRTPVILQGHIDMVTVKEDSVTLDLTVDGIPLYEENGFIQAKGTSLGADNGIAVAYMLALLADTKAIHPPLECIFTTDEEIGLEGVAELDISSLQGKRMINLDSEEEGLLLTGCAGGSKVQTVFSGKKEEKMGVLYEIVISGCTGGHSGIDIHKGRGNSNKLMGRVLTQLDSSAFSLVFLQGGGKDNVISTSSKAQLLVSPLYEKTLEEICQKLEKVLQSEFIVSDPQMKLFYKKISKKTESYQVFNDDFTKKVLVYLNICPNGVETYTPTLENMVETSLNLGTIETVENNIRFRHAIRSSVQSKIQELTTRVTDFAQYLQGETTVSGEYPPWEYAQHSPLRDELLQVYREMYGKPMIVSTLHAGLECGYMMEKIPDLDCVSIGPTMFDVHSFNERVEIESVKRVWEYLLELLKKL